MSRPAVVILCPKEFKFTDHEASVERPFLADVAASNPAALMAWKETAAWKRPAPL